MTKATLQLGDAEPAVVDVEGVVRAAPTRRPREVPAPSDTILALKEHLYDAAPWDQAVLGQAQPADIIRACQLLADEFDMDTFQCQSYVADQAVNLTLPMRLFMQWVFAARVGLRGLLPYLRPAVALTFLPSGGRFTEHGVDRLGCTNTVVMHILPQDGGRMEILMRGYIATKDTASGEILGVGGPQGCVFCKNLRLVPGLRRLSAVVKAEKRDTRGGAEAVRRRVAKVTRMRQESQMDETLFEDARAARPDLENSIIMQTGMEMLLALRAFGETRKASDQLDQMAHLCGARSGEELAENPSIAGPGLHGDKRVEALVGIRRTAEAYHWSTGRFHFQRFLHAFARHETPIEIPTELFRQVSGIDGPCLEHEAVEASRRNGHTLRPLLQFEDMSELLDTYGVAMFEGRQVLAARSEGTGMERKWFVKLAGDDPDSPPREMSSAQYLGGFHRHLVPQVVDVVYGVSRSRKTRCPRSEEMRFAAGGVSISLSPDDVNPKFSEWQHRNRRS